MGGPGTPYTQSKLMNKIQVRNTQINVIQINLQHSRTATDNLMEIINLQGIDIVLIQEPYIIKNKVAGISRNFKILSQGENKIRAAILIANRYIDAILISQLTDGDAAVIEIIYGNLRFYAASIYMDMETDINNDLRKMDKIIDYTKGSGLLIAVDSNARSKTWHDTITNPRGRIIEEYLSSKQLYIMNEESENTTFESKNGKSNNDLTITNSKLMPRLKEWECGREESCSDHRYITYNIKQCIDEITELKFYGTKYIFNEEKLEEFSKVIKRELSQNVIMLTNNITTEEIDEELSRLTSTETDSEKIVQQFEENVSKACKKCFRVSKPTNKINKRKSLPWWTTDLTIMRKKTNALRRRYQKTKNNQELREQRKTQYMEEKKYEKTIKKEKIESWKQYCNLTSSNNPWNAVYRLATGKTRSSPHLTTLTKPDGTATQDLKETMNYMLDYFVPEDKETEDNEYHKLVRTENLNYIATQNDREFTQGEVKDILERMDPRKTPGEDGITSKILLKVFESFPKYMTAIYNSCLRIGNFPEQWKRATLIPIVKPGNEKISEVRKYRPISLLNTAGKVLEKLLISRISHHVYTKNLVNDSQYGFTPQKSTTDAAMAVKGYVEENLRSGQSVVLISLDVQGAFDAAWWPSILKSLRDFNCPSNLYNLTRNYFSQRTAVLAVNNIKIERKVSKGCPQGSCSGPGFWNLQYNSLLNLNYTRHTKVVAFADDLLVITKGTSTLEAENYANVELKKIEYWAKNNKIRFNEQKTKALLINRKRKDGRNINIYLNNKAIEQVERIKYLGIIIDQNFNFNDHIQHVTEKTTKLIHALSKSAKLNWGLQHQALKTIYKGAILPLLSYAAPVWIEALNRKYNCTKYIRVQRLINIKIAKAFRTTSTEALCVLTGLTPIIYKLREIAEEYKIMKQSSEWQVDIPLNYKKWPHPADFPTIQEANLKKNYTVEVYTDGSRTEQGVGSGIAIFIHNEIVHQLQYKLDKHCSNNQAEQLAILKAMEKIETIELMLNSPKNAAIYTDSKVTLDSLRNTKNHNQLIESIREKFRILSKQNWTIDIGWVKAHIGIQGNEMADKLAKRATVLEGLECYKKVPKSTIQKILREESIAKWENEWRNTTKGEETRQYFPTVAKRLKLRITLTPNLTTMLTGHGRLRAYYQRFHITEDSTCSCRGGEQTVNHILYDCNKLDEDRKKLKRNIIQKGGTWPANKMQLIGKFMNEYRKFINAIELENL